MPPQRKEKAEATAAGAPAGGAPTQTRRDGGQFRRGNKDRAGASGSAGAGTGTSSGTQGGGRSGGGKPNFGKSGGGKPGGGKPKESFAKQHAPKPKPKPLKPITKGMVEGVEPMRTFGDLIQFYEKKKGPEEQSEPEKKS